MVWRQMRQLTVTDLALPVRQLHHLLDFTLRNVYLVILQLGKEVFDVNLPFVRNNSIRLPVRQGCGIKM